MDCIEGAVEYFAEAGELAKMAMAELDATKGELAQLKEALSAAQLDQIFCFTLLVHRLREARRRRHQELGRHERPGQPHKSRSSPFRATTMYAIEQSMGLKYYLPAT